MKKKRSFVGELVEAVIIAVILAAVIRIFLFQPFFIPSCSMYPTLQPGDRIIVNKLVYRFDEPERGDIIVFRYPLDRSKDYIKRIIAVGGEKVAIRENYVYINGKPLKESYLPRTELSDYDATVVPEGTFFVMGDNRNDSQDSRYWGMVPRRDVIGKAVFIFWPPERIGFIK